MCSPEEKLESRRMLVATVRRSVELLVLFVKGNSKNQEIVFRSAMPLLRQLTGPLVMYVARAFRLF